MSLKMSRVLSLQQRTPNTKEHLEPEGNLILILIPQLEQQSLSKFTSVLETPDITSVGGNVWFHRKDALSD